MDWKLFGTAFVTLFLAEMGDKTQLAAMTLTASTQSPWTVLAGSVLALALVSAIGVFAGQAITLFVTPRTFSRIAAVAFVATGIFLWFKA
jgi:putative Ca2+/H+ antiporter (TMEM165/GDT1 family)